MAKSRRRGYDPGLANEAKAIVATAFRNGPLENIHAGKLCPSCGGAPQYSHISQDEMKALMKYAVDTVYTMLCMREYDPANYAATVERANLHYTKSWDDPQLRGTFAAGPNRHT